MKNKFAYLLLPACLLVLNGCTVDKENPKYDERRYTELQKARCGEIATVISKPLLTEVGGDYDLSMKRCVDMKTLSFEEYKLLADYARANGVWDLYAVFPDKFEAPVPASDKAEANQ